MKLLEFGTRVVDGEEFIFLKIEKKGSIRKKGYLHEIKECLETNRINCKNDIVILNYATKGIDNFIEIITDDENIWVIRFVNKNVFLIDNEFHFTGNNKATYRYTGDNN